MANNFLSIVQLRSKVTVSFHRPNPHFLDFLENDSDQDMAPKKSRLAAAPLIDFDTV